MKGCNYLYLYTQKGIQKNLSLTDYLRPGIFHHFLLHRGFSLSEVKNVLVTGIKIFVLTKEVFSIMFLIQRVLQMKV